MHRWSRLFIPTLREAPSDAEVASHQLLLRAGYVRQLGAGIYSYLPLATRSLNKIIAIVREEMDRIGQEFYLPALHPREVWEESGRWTGMGDNMFRLKDRKGADLALGMTHEEVMTSIARNEVRSYKQLPQIWYQIQTKFRDEPRPKSGLLRVRQFTMKDSYSFDIDAAGLDESYNKHDEAYRRIFTRSGLEFVAVDADSGSMGGSESKEFMVYTEAGEDLIASARDEDGNVVYAANLEKATSTLAPVEDLPASGDGLPELVHTPWQRTIDEVGAFLGVAREHQIKTMVFIAEFKGSNGSLAIPIVVALRGDHKVNETKLASLLKSGRLDLAATIGIPSIFGAPVGYLSPVGVPSISSEQFAFLQERGVLPKTLVGEDQKSLGVFDDVQFRVYKNLALTVLDAALENRTQLVAGANKENYHLRNVTPGRDFTPTLIADIRNINEGEPAPISGRPLRRGKALEIGHIFKLGYKYSESMGARVLDRNGKETTPIMGSYGIGIERILTAAIEQSAAARGRNDRGEWSYTLPPSIAPYAVVVTVTKQNDPVLAEAGERIAADLEAAGFDVLLDDRDGSAGIKFKDADLIGVPFRITVGKGIAIGTVELVDRRSGDVVMEIPVSEAASRLRSLMTTSSEKASK